MEMVLIKIDSNEWIYMWEWLAAHPINKDLDEPTVALNDGEAWQYMGSYRSKDKRVIHTFRHRKHINNNNQLKELSVTGSINLNDEDIEKILPIK